MFKFAVILSIIFVTSNAFGDSFREIAKDEKGRFGILVKMKDTFNQKNVYSVRVLVG